MKTEVGEYIVGAYLQVIKGCDFVGYNVRSPSEGIKGLNEFDVVGLDFSNKIAYLCEVTTHLNGVNYGSYESTIGKIRGKHCEQKDYAEKYLSNFPDKCFMFWSPIVPKGYMTDELKKIEKEGLHLVINEEYTRCVDELKDKAKESKKDIGNPFFRTLQILEHLRREK